jgi:hypothetical protein
MLVTTEEELEFMQLIPFQLHGFWSTLFHLVLADSEFTRRAIACMMSPCAAFIGRGVAAATAGGTSRKEKKNKNGSSSRRRKKPWLAQGPYLLSTIAIPTVLGLPLD